MKYTVREVAKFIKESVDWLIEQDMGCATLKLDDRLAVCVGWSAGFGSEKRDDVIQSKSEPDYAIMAGIKVWTSDDMRTDYDFINYSYYKDGDVNDISLSIGPADAKDDFLSVAKALVRDYEQFLKDLEISEDGEITEKSVKESKNLKEDKNALTNSKYKSLIGKYFDYSYDFKFLDVVANVLDRVDDFSNEEDIYQAMDSELIYDEDLWTILKFYSSSAREVNYEKAMNDFSSDIFALAQEILKEKED